MIYKNNKILSKAKEILNDGTGSYNINGIDLSLATFFYRTLDRMFVVMAPGDYRIDTVGNNTMLVITNEDVKTKSEMFQICYAYNMTSSSYDPLGDPDINIIKDKYNQLFKDFQFLFEYVRKDMLVSDSTEVTLVIPKIEKDEVLVGTDEGYRSMSLVDANQEIKNIIDKYSQEKKDELDAYLTNVIKPDMNTTAQTYVNHYVETEAKPNINTYTQDKINEFEQFAQDIIDKVYATRGEVPNGADWYQLDDGLWTVSDFKSGNFVNAPNITSVDENTGFIQVLTNPNDGLKTIRYTAGTSMYFNFRQNNIWKEYVKISQDTGSTRFKIAQPNHGFILSPVRVDLSSTSTNTKFVPAIASIGADALASRIDDNEFWAYVSGEVVIPTNAVDDEGNTLVNDEYYFTSETKAGFLQRKSPFRYHQSMLHAAYTTDRGFVGDVKITPVFDQTPRIYDEQTMRDLNMLFKEDLDTVDFPSLQTPEKKIIPAINTLNNGKVSKAGDTMTGGLTVSDPNNNGRKTISIGTNGKIAVSSLDENPSVEFNSDVVAGYVGGVYNENCIRLGNVTGGISLSLYSNGSIGLVGSAFSFDGGMGDGYFKLKNDKAIGDKWYSGARIIFQNDGRESVFTSLGNYGLYVFHTSANQFPVFRMINGSTGVSYDVSLTSIADRMYNVEVAANSKLPLTGGTITGPVDVQSDFTANAIFSRGDITAYSDKRLKMNIKKIENPLEKIDQLNGYTHTWRYKPGKSIGVIAQEVEKVFPEIVIEDTSNNKINYKSVDYGKLSALLIECVKELKNKNEELTERIKTLEGIKKINTDTIPL